MLSYIFVLDALVYLRWEVGGAGGGGGDEHSREAPKALQEGEREERTNICGRKKCNAEMGSGPERPGRSGSMHDSPTSEDTGCVFWRYGSIHLPADMTIGQGIR